MEKQNILIKLLNSTDFTFKDFMEEVFKYSEFSQNNLEIPNSDTIKLQLEEARSKLKEQQEELERLEQYTYQDKVNLYVEKFKEDQAKQEELGKSKIDKLKKIEELKTNLKKWVCPVRYESIKKDIEEIIKFTEDYLGAPIWQQVEIEFLDREQVLICYLLHCLDLKTNIRTLEGVINSLNKKIEKALQQEKDYAQFIKSLESIKDTD